MRSLTQKFLDKDAHTLQEKNVLELCRLWTETERQLCEIALLMGKLNQTDAVKLKALETQEDVAQSIQNSVVQSLLETPSSSINETIAKLSVWRDSTFPLGGISERNTPVQNLALIALEELEQLSKEV